VNVDVDPNFRLYMVTRLANPTYLPEASTMVNLVNFTVTRQVGSESAPPQCRRPLLRLHHSHYSVAS
jgi:hypothetical protein